MTYTNDRWDWPKNKPSQQDKGAAAHITRTETAAAKLLLELDRVEGRESDPRVVEIAEHKRSVAQQNIFGDAVHEVFTRAESLLLRKHEDYGPKNISQSPGGPLNGLRVRMHDKTARLNHLIDSGNEPNHESIEDTLLDLANYALIGILVLRGQWPSE